MQECRVENAWLGPLIVLILAIIVALAAMKLERQIIGWYHRHEAKLHEYGGLGFFNPTTIPSQHAAAAPNTRPERDGAVRHDADTAHSQLDS